MTTIASTNVMRIILDLYKRTFSFEVGNNRLSCLVSVHSGILGIFVGNLCVVGHYIDNRQIVTESYLKVIRVVCRCNLYNAGTKIHFDVVVGNNGDFAFNQR